LVTMAIRWSVPSAAAWLFITGVMTAAAMDSSICTRTITGASTYDLLLIRVCPGSREDIPAKHP
jgi:hypothetical protein